MINSLIALIIIGIVLGIVFWFLDYLPVPEPFNKVLKVVCVGVFLIVVIYFLLGLIGNVPEIKVG